MYVDVTAVGGKRSIAAELVKWFFGMKRTAITAAAYGKTSFPRFFMVAFLFCFVFSRSLRYETFVFTVHRDGRKWWWCTCASARICTACLGIHIIQYPSVPFIYSLSCIG